MRLYHHPISSNSRRVMMAAIHLDVQLDLTEISLMDAPTPTAQHSAPTHFPSPLPPHHVNQNQSPNSDNRPHQQQVSDCEDDGLLLRQQEAALIRARLAAKSEAYTFERARANHGKPQQLDL